MRFPEFLLIHIILRQQNDRWLLCREIIFLIKKIISQLLNHLLIKKGGEEKKIWILQKHGRKSSV